MLFLGLHDFLFVPMFAVEPSLVFNLGLLELRFRPIVLCCGLQAVKGLGWGFCLVWNWLRCCVVARLVTHLRITVTIGGPHDMLFPLCTAHEISGYMVMVPPKRRLCLRKSRFSHSSNESSRAIV
ncbi:hypothetical protein Dimus_006885 [Dionaea muscipula]